MSKQPLRGSKDALIYSVIETLKIRLKYADNVQELRAAIRVVVEKLEQERDQFKKIKK